MFLDWCLKDLLGKLDLIDRIGGEMVITDLGLAFLSEYYYTPETAIEKLARKQQASQSLL